MELGLFATFMSPIGTPKFVAELGQRMESAGLESLWMGEHVVLFDEMEFPYPGSRDGRIPVPQGGGMLDTVATFGFLANATSKLRLGTGITLVPQRNPVYTAKEFATLDYLSDGRIDFGVGVGWCKEEVLACGYSWADRGARCDEFLQVIQRLWTEPVAEFHGKHFDLPACRLDPKPLQKPHVPMIVGGHTQAGLRRAARFGTGWYGFALDPKLTATLLKQLDAELAVQGRSRENFEIVITPSRDDPDTVREFIDLGVDRLILQLGSQRAAKVDQRLRDVDQLMQVCA